MNISRHDFRSIRRLIASVLYTNILGISIIQCKRMLKDGVICIGDGYLPTYSQLCWCPDVLAPNALYNINTTPNSISAFRYGYSSWLTNMFMLNDLPVCTTLLHLLLMVS